MPIEDCRTRKWMITQMNLSDIVNLDDYADESF